jgi:AcrR family transcriptional regulator
MTIHAPRQARSAASLDRLLAAAEEVLRERSFDEAGLAEIARRAGATVGTFYARFPGKEALLRHLEERLYAGVAALVGAKADALAAGERPLPALVRELLLATIGFYREHRGALRALTLRSRSDPELRARMDETNRRSLAALAPAFAPHAARIGHPDPGEAVPFAVLMAGHTLREAILFREPWLEDAGWTDEKLAGELARAVLAYLGVSADEVPAG